MSTSVFRRSLPWFIVAVASGCIPAPQEALPDNSAAAHPSPPTRATPIASPAPLAGDLGRIADIAERATPSVVNISSSKTVRMDPGTSPFHSDPFFRQFFGERGMPQMPRERRERSLGSGVIVTQDGVILTNNHVVANADDIRVALSDGRELEAKIVGTDPDSDVAVIRLEDPPKDLVAIELGDSEQVRLGQVVLAIGNPFGVGQTVTMGIVSAKGRANVGIVDYEDFIQTDAAINPGNSGGALVDLQGKLIGINTAILSRSGGYQGVGFAIPSNMARSVMDSLIENGKVVRGFLGVMIQDLNRDLAKALGLEIEQGVLVSDVVRDSPADEAGLKPRDVIVEIDGQPTHSAARLRSLVASKGAGTKIEVKVNRDGSEQTVHVTLTEKDKGAAAGSGAPQKDVLGGLTVQNLDAQLRTRFEIPDKVENGVVVTAVEAGSKAEQAGIQVGDVILEVNRTEIHFVPELSKAYREAGDTVALRIFRRGASMFLVLRK